MKNLLLITFGTVALGTLAFAETNENIHSGMPLKSNMSMTKHSMPAMEMSMMASLDRLTGKSFDRAFLSMMVSHHEAAVAMSKAVLPTKDPQVKAWAEDIIRAQDTEIKQMNSLLRRYGGANIEMANQMKYMMVAMVSDVKKSKDKDNAFVEGMLPHHNSAIIMANTALMRSQNRTILKLAKDIVRSQAQEMYDFKLYLLK